VSIAVEEQMIKQGRYRVMCTYSTLTNKILQIAAPVHVPDCTKQLCQGPCLAMQHLDVSA
jgi:hypothetical protein